MYRLKKKGVLWQTRELLSLGQLISEDESQSGGCWR